MTQPLLQAADLRGAASLTADVVEGLAELVASMQADRAAPRGPAGPEVDALLAWLTPRLIGGEVQGADRDEREAVLAALNGVLGDHLATLDHPLAIAMTFRWAGRPLALERYALRTRLGPVGPRVVVLLHGSCQNDLQWQRAGQGHAEALARERACTLVHLHYNSGLSVSTNGRILAALMERLYDAWPVPIERLVMVGHGSGGLVARSAIHHGAMIQRGGLRWHGRVNDLICLGTPHGGAPLGSAGLDLLLHASPHARALARVARVPSAGLHDLHRGNVVGGPAADDGRPVGAPVPLPDGPHCHAIAARRPTSGQGGPDRAPGDGLVTVTSALGRHPEVHPPLAFAEARRAEVPDTRHPELLSSAEVYGLLGRWLQ